MCTCACAASVWQIMSQVIASPQSMSHGTWAEIHYLKLNDSRLRYESLANGSWVMNLDWLPWMLWVTSQVWVTNQRFLSRKSQVASHLDCDESQVPNRLTNSHEWLWWVKLNHGSLSLNCSIFIWLMCLERACYWYSLQSMPIASALCQQIMLFT